MERTQCRWRDLEGVVYHELLKSSEIVNRILYQKHIDNLDHALMVKRPQWTSRHDKFILLPDNASPHASKPVNKHVRRSYLGSITPPAVFTRPCAVRISLIPVNGAQTVAIALPNDVARWSTQWFASKEAKFNWDGTHTLPDI
ncbi:hypothetical protein AVEN_222754-1 [Araneus ventricosus]|uniref:Tc1-like transposase DDE domain-containing protein n=1 Tax=Araneus ventricosus TaxID=182803 RepID=A0A4Y2AZJ5_ARAVE|nr:hypothetical protein AVEN_222754-1 [Araneus ventricosus]